MAQETYFSSQQRRDLWAHLATYLTGIGGDFARIKFVVCKTAHSLSSIGVLRVLLCLYCPVRDAQQGAGRPSPYRAPSADVKNGWSYTSTPLIYHKVVHLCFRPYPYCRQHANRNPFHVNSPQCSVSFAPRPDSTSHRRHIPIDQKRKYDEETLR